jgi:hypothetical protein
VWSAGGLGSVNGAGAGRGYSFTHIRCPDRAAHPVTRTPVPSAHADTTDSPAASAQRVLVSVVFTLRGTSYTGWGGRSEKSSDQSKSPLSRACTPSLGVCSNTTEPRRTRSGPVPK